MFLKSVTELAVDFGDVRAAMLGDPHAWLAELAKAAGDDGDQLLVKTGLAAGGHPASGRAGRLEVGEAMATNRVAVLPLHIVIADDTRLFPSLQGSLDAAWLGNGRTHLAMNAMYESPSGLADRPVNRTLLHRVTEAVAQRFLEAVAHELTARTAIGPTGPSPFAS
jgi:hypothetical protein